MQNPSRHLGCLFTTGALLFALSGVKAQNQGADWPQFRGPGGQGVSAAKGLPVTWSATENVVWKTELPGAGTSSPIIVGPRVFITCFSGYGLPGQERGDQELLKLHLLCLDRTSGRILWNQEVAPRLPEQPTMREGHGYASSTPAADTERIYAFFGRSGVVAFNHEGKQLWKSDVGSQLNGWGSAASPVLFGDLVIVNASVESESVVALNKKTGQEVWRKNGIREAWNTPLLVTLADGKTELVVATMGKLFGLNPTTGEELWSCATGIGWYMVPSLVAHDGIIYCIGGRSGGSLAVRAGGRGDVTETHRIWTGRKGSNVSSPIVHKGHLYWMHENQGIAYCAETKSGEIVYEQRVDGADQVYASPVLSEDKLFYVTRTGRSFVVAAKPTFELIAKNAPIERSIFNASPAVAGNHLFLRSDRHLYCLGQK